jgi:predicted MPP superfamily phosphohydrolase
MKTVRDPSESASRPWGRLILLGVLALLLAALALAYLRTHYGWRDIFTLFHHMAGQLSRRRLAAALLVSAGAVWLAARWRSTPLVAYPALFAYGVGVLADAALLLSLEPLGISFGPVLLPMAILVAARSTLAVALGLAAMVAGRGVRRAPLWLGLHVSGQALLLGLVIYGFAVEPMRLTVTHVPVMDPHRTGTAEPALRIVQLSDLHVERANGLTRRVVETVNGLQPDLIFLTGDYLSTSSTGDPQAQADLRQAVAGLQARHGIYAILGNTDPPGSRQTLFGGLPLVVLEDEWTTVEIEGRRLAIAGVTTYQARGSGRTLASDRAALAALQGAMPQDCYTILLYHSPNLVPEAAAAGFDLYPTGHTHGGQIRLPLYGALTTFSIYGKRYEMGRYQVEGMLAYVSRGIGMEGWLIPRTRFLCPPEIVCYELQ